ncbi:hypothetical protein CYD26_21115 [Pseudomonas sp. FFUP_PS_473]|nr:hypothetical protein CYD26_21115 [Pseudomonas sp. FFUP_PS_473]
MQAATVLGWGEILKIVLASGVVAALIGILKDVFLKRRERKQDALFAAIGLVAKLDLYALQSRARLWDYDERTAELNPHQHDQNWPTCTYPDLEISDDALKHLSLEHASDLAWISTEKAIAGQYLSIVDEVSFDPTEVHARKAEVVGYFGYEAFLLARKLRTAYGLPSFGQRWGVHEDFPDLLRAWKKTKNEVARHAQPLTADDI